MLHAANVKHSMKGSFFFLHSVSPFLLALYFVKVACYFSMHYLVWLIMLVLRFSIWVLLA